MTEDKARQKWCPMARVGADHQSAVDYRPVASYNRVDFDQGDPASSLSLCIASDCMMWRETEFSRYTGIPGGYCGLAGKY